MAKFIELPLVDGKVVCVNADYIEEVRECDETKCDVYMAFSCPDAYEQDLYEVNLPYSKVVCQILDPKREIERAILSEVIQKFDAHRDYHGETILEVLCWMGSGVSVEEAQPISPDVVEVVRCVDCKWWNDQTCTNKNGAYGTTIFNPGWFCRSGQRKEE